MSTFLVAAILISVIVSICLILVYINNKHRKKTKAALVTQFSKLGTINNLSFSSQEILDNFIIGLDGRKRILLILNKVDIDKYEPLLLNLDEVKNCSIRKVYSSVNIGTAKKIKFADQIDKIVLAFDFIDNRQPVEVLFFDLFTSNILTMSDLELKAKNWEAIILQIVNKGFKRIA